MKYLLALVAALVPCVALGGQCQTFFGAKVVHSQYGHHVQQQVVYPQLYYRVGLHQQIEASVTKQLRDDPTYQEFLQFKAFREGMRQGAQEANRAEQQRANSVLHKRCASCHGTDQQAPKGGVYFDAGHAIGPQSITSALRKIRDDEMPPNKPLTPEEKAAVMQELLELEASE